MIIGTCVVVLTISSLLLDPQRLGLLGLYPPVIQRATRSEEQRIQSGSTAYVRAVMAGTDERAKRMLISTVWELRLVACYTSLAASLSSFDLSTRLSVVAVYEQIPVAHLVPIRALLAAACVAETDGRLKARLGALVASAGG